MPPKKSTKTRKALPKKNDAKKTVKKTRISALALCIRKTANTSKLSRKFMPDYPDFKPAELAPGMSSKFTRLIQQIRELDAADMREKGTLFKHFIFTDIRESAYGAKALASFMIAAGFEFTMGIKQKQVKRHGKLVTTQTGDTVYTQKGGVPGGSNRFAMLQSLPLWKNPLSVTTKKEILKAFNSRPDNIYGEHLRIIILDSKFKEGIDLFDVKYAHLVEPAIATSDLKQAVGRATRFCGQKGLPFAPRRGWPLHVYVYNTELPKKEPFLLDGQQTHAHELMLAKSGLDLALLQLTKELTILAIQSAVDYDLNYKINNFDIEAALLEATDVEDVLVAEVAPGKQAGGAARGRPKLVAIHRAENITPALLTKCAKSESKLFPFSLSHMRTIAKQMGLGVPKGAKRSYYCEMMRDTPKYLEAVVSAPVERRQRPSVSSLVATPSSPQDSRDSRDSPVADYLQSRMSNNMNALNDDVLLDIPALFKTPNPSPTRKQLTADLTRDLSSLSFENFQKEIASVYAKYKWTSPIVKNGCETTIAGKPGSLVTFTKTQDFVRHYLKPDSPYKGLLAWHSVGTGKTCMAIAAATTYFEQAGYTILWVTRNALMADVYKNIFGSVCSIPIMEKLQNGAKLPEDLTKQKRMLSRAWLQPISYRTFQNALQKKNELGRMLYGKNASDPLRKTFLIMDEVHKLQDGDLSASEAADFHVIQDYIYKSYETSGQESVRPLLMTATPITDSPKELFEILNTLIPNKKDRLPAFQDYRNRFVDETGSISPAGREYFQDKAKGLISYLNREFDPTTFSQPVFHTISVPLLSIAAPPSVEELADKCMTDIGLDSYISEAIQEQNCDAELERDMELVDKEISRLETAIAEIDAQEGKAKKEIRDEKVPLKTELETLKKSIPAIKKRHETMRNKCIESNKNLARMMPKTRKITGRPVFKDMLARFELEKKLYEAQAVSEQGKELEACFKKADGSKGQKEPKAKVPKEKGKKGEKKQKESDLPPFVDENAFVAELERRFAQKA